MIKNNTLYIFFAIFFSISIITNKLLQPDPIHISKQKSAFNIDDQFLTVVFSSHKRFLSDIYWILTLLESDTHHYKKKDLNNWMFLRFKTISMLDPLFLNNYQFGSKYLSIIKDDIDGADLLFTRALNYYPNDYDLTFNAGFFYGFDKKEFDKSYFLFNKIKDHEKAPKFIKSLLAKIKFQETGDLKITFQVLKEIYKASEDEFLKDKLEKDLYALKAMIDLECLNKRKEGCSQYDFKGSSYIKINNRYIAREKFIDYKLNSKN